MRIRELLESKMFDETEFVKQTGDKRELDYDLVEDLVHFMNHDDEIYRRHLFPVISKYIDAKENKHPKMNVFKPVVEKSYKVYVNRFPIRQLPEDIDMKLCKEVCEKIHEDTLQHISDGKYKD